MAKTDARFVGIESVVFGAPDLSVPRKLFADWGLKKLQDGKSGVAFATEIGSRVVVRPSAAKGLPPKLSGGSEFREVMWGVSHARHLDALERELSRDRSATVDADGTLHSVDDSGVNIGFRVWRHGAEPRAARCRSTCPARAAASTSRARCTSARVPSAWATSSSPCPTCARARISM